jgi:AcrR family transcriptional regulator
MTQRANAPTRIRTRLAPAVRREQILDHAGRLVVEEGLTGVSMERIAEEAGISKALIYAYFSNQTDLLKDLLRRDLERIQAEQMAAAQSARTFAELVRNTTHVALMEAERRGALLGRLMSEPSLTASLDTVKTHEHTSNVRYLAKRIAREFDVSMPDALALTEIGLGLTLAAGELVSRSAARRQDIEDMTVDMIIGAVRTGAAQRRRATGKAAAGRPRRRPERQSSLRHP